MAKTVENVFVDVTGKDERPFITQHQKHFRWNVIARFNLEDGRVFLKVPYIAGEVKAIGLTREQFEAIQPKSTAFENVTDGR